MSDTLLAYLAFIVACLALARALTDHFRYKRRIAELHRKTLEAQRLVKQRGSLANEIAHEIKNPITAILCSAEALDLLLGDKLEDTHRKSLRYIKEYGDNLLRLVTDFLDISRAEAGQMKARLEPVAVAPLMESISGLLNTNAMRKEISVRVVATAENLMCHADPKHLKQILFNLLHNAIKFTGQKGEITFVARSNFPEPSLKIELTDNGAGMSEDLIEHLFNPYARYDDGREAPAEAGFGLGLALCKNLAELSGGTIRARSKLGVGTTFELTLPEHRPEPAQMPAARRIEDGEAEPQPLKGQKFLVVDEDLGAREAIARLIEAWGGMVDKVSLAVDAVEAIGHKNYDAVMIDDSMGGIYGHELARLIREDLKGGETKIIVASKNPVDADLMRESGADSCIEKPLNGKVLLESLLRSGKYYMTH